MTRDIQKGSTSQSCIIRIVDTSGIPVTGVVAATAGLDLFYRRTQSAIQSLTESDLASISSSYSAGGIKHIGAGYYRVDVPDAAFVTGAVEVLIAGTVTGMVVIGELIQLRDYAFADIIALLPSALVGGRMDSSVGAMAANVMNAAAAAPDLTTELQSGLATSAAITTLQADTDDLQTRIPAALVGGRMASDLGSIAGSTSDVTKLAGLVKQRIGGGTLRAGSTTTSVNLAASDGADWWDDFGNVEIQITGGAITGQTFIVQTITGAGGATPVVVPKLPSTLSAAPGTVTYEVFALTQAEDPLGFAVPGAYGVGTVGYIIGHFLNTDVGAAVTSILAAIASDAATGTTVANRLGAWAGTGLNTVLGAFLALLNKGATVPSDLASGYLPATDSLEANADATTANAELVFTRSMGAKFGGITYAQHCLAMAAATYGKSTGLPLAPIYRDPGDTQNVVTGVTDGIGNRSSVTLIVAGA